MPTLVQLEDALIARLAGGVIKTVEAEQGRLADLVRERRVDRPTALIHLESFEDEPFATRVFERTVQIQVFLVVPNYRGSDQARRGTDSELGVYGAIDYVAGRLSGQTLGLTIRPLRSLGCHSLLPPEGPGRQDQKPRGPFAAYRYDWAASWTWDAAQTDADAAAETHTTTHVGIDAGNDDDTDIGGVVEHDEP